jgi:zinc protease
MAAKSKSLPKLDVSSLPSPETIARSQLENGIVVLARANFASPSVVIAGYLPAGALFESPELAGLADMTASALMRGTEQRSFHEIYQSIESIGASLRFGASSHAASFRGKSLVADLDVILNLIAEVLTEPTFPKKAVEQLQGEHLTGLALRDQDTRAVAGMTFDALAYPNHPYSIPSDGYRETVAAFKRKDLKAFHKRTYGPSGLVLAIVGAIEPQAAIERVRQALGGWATKRSTMLMVPDAAALARTERRSVELAGKTQADLVLGCPGPRRSEPDYLAAALGNSVLGRFGLMGRIGDSVRERAGLAYYAYSSLNGGIGPGPWQIAAGVNPANVDRALALCVEELERFVGEPVTEDELADVQANFIGRLPLQLESNDGVAGALLHVERHDLGLDYYPRYPQLVAEVTRQQIQSVAGRFLDPARLAVAIAGPPEKAA